MWQKGNATISGSDIVLLSFCLQGTAEQNKQNQTNPNQTKGEKGPRKEANKCSLNGRSCGVVWNSVTLQMCVSS